MRSRSRSVLLTKMLESLPFRLNRPATSLSATPASVAAPSVTPSDLAWRVIGLLNLYRLLVPLMLITLQVFGGAGMGPGGHANPPCSWRPASPTSPPPCCWSSRDGCIGRACASSPWSMPAWTRSRSGSFSMRAAVSRAVSPSCWCCPVLALTVLADRRDALLIAAVGALAVLVQQVFVGLTRRQLGLGVCDGRIPGPGAVRRRTRHVAGRQPLARERGAGPSPGARPREHGAAVAVHRAAPAGEHPGHRRAGSHPA